MAQSLKELQRKQAVFKVFYRDYEHDVSIPSHKPESLLASRIAPLAERLLQHPDNFFGVQDANDIILQCYLDDDENHWMMELMYPEATGCLRLRMTAEQAKQVLSELPVEFTEDTLPGAQFINI